MGRDIEAGAPHYGTIFKYDHLTILIKNFAI